MTTSDNSGTEWYKVLDKNVLSIGEVKTVFAGHEQICLSRTEEGYGAICNSCPHQGGPLGEGFLDTLPDGKHYVICPWHAYEYEYQTGKAPEGFDDVSEPFLVEERDDGIYVAVERKEHKETIMDQMVSTMINWGVNAVFGMVGHSNLGLADAFYRKVQTGDLTYIGIRHEGAAAFAASGYAKVTGKPAACFSIAGPGATNLYTGLWDAKVDRVPILALTGQVDTKYLGPHNFQEIPTEKAFSAVSSWSQTVILPENALELMALAVKNAVINRDVAHLVFPDEVQNLPALEDPPEQNKKGRIASEYIRPQIDLCKKAINMINNAETPAIIIGNGGRRYGDKILQFAEMIDAPVITTFKAKGSISEAHPLATGVLGRSGTPIASAVMGKSDLLIVFGATFSKHTGIADYKKIIQVDFDRMNLGKFHPVEIPIWGEIGQTLEIFREEVEEKSRPNRLEYVANRWLQWREEKATRASLVDENGRIMNAAIFEELSKVIPDDVILSVDVGNNTYSFGRYFESKKHELIMSGYLGSIGFGFPAAIGAAVARPDAKIVVIAGDGGFGQYAMEFTTAVKYNLNITLILLNNSELAKITKEQKSLGTHVFETSLTNPNFADYANSCGGMGIRVENRDQLKSSFQKAIEYKGPSLVEIISTSDPK